ncbi:hypothetical protein KKF34_06900 [Myxococcota bacterium]|nr:hypothetical protein [Myxococcota bacterium]MBU1381434.1 hypothetical protein [Myxococcota bacterium]MBU1496589.1 hypothetical protein [Myxococcota bacterium]
MTDVEIKWECRICGFSIEGTRPPVECPLCKAPDSDFFKSIARSRTTVQRPVQLPDRTPPGRQEIPKDKPEKTRRESFVIEHDDIQLSEEEAIPLSPSPHHLSHENDDTARLRKALTDLFILVPILERHGYPELAVSLKNVISDTLVTMFRSDSENNHKALSILSGFNNRHVLASPPDAESQRQLKNLDVFISRIKQLL